MLHHSFIHKYIYATSCYIETPQDEPASLLPLSAASPQRYVSHAHVQVRSDVSCGCIEVSLRLVVIDILFGRLSLAACPACENKPSLS